MFEAILSSNLTAPGLLGVVFLLVVSGLLVPWRTYGEKKQEAERWRLAFETEREGRIVSDKQTSELLEAQKTSHKLIVAIFENSKAAAEERQTGDQNVAS